MPRICYGEKILAIPEYEQGTLHKVTKTNYLPNGFTWGL